VAGEVNLGTFGQQPFATALAAAGEDGTASFCGHPCTKAVLLFAGAFGGLIGAFHKKRCDKGFGMAAGSRLGDANVSSNQLPNGRFPWEGGNKYERIVLSTIHSQHCTSNPEESVYAG